MKLEVLSILKAVNGKAYNVIGTIDFVGVSIDSREDILGKFFIPLRGEHNDGHDFLREAYDKGAILFSEKETSFPHIRVENTYEALKSLAAYYLSLFNIEVIGITGSAGKTTTKDIIASVLSEKFNTVKTHGNFNNEIGLPLTIFRVDEKTEVLVLEMGMNHLGEIHRLANIARPSIAIITNIGEAHIEFLGSKENIRKAKMEILDFSPKHIILNGDDEMLQNIYGADYYYFSSAENLNRNGLSGTSATLNLEEKTFDIEINTPGDYMVQNAIVAAKVGLLLGLTISQIQDGIKKFAPSSNRMKIEKRGSLSIINDVYNASPSSMKAVIELLSIQKGEKILVLGDMFELGDFSQKYHKEVGEFALENIETLYAIGEFAKYYGGTYFETKEEFLQSDEFKNLKEAEATVLFKASRGMEFEQIIEKI